MITSLYTYHKTYATVTTTTTPTTNRINNGALGKGLAPTGQTLMPCQGTIGIKGTAEAAPAHIMVKATRDHQEDFSSTTHRAEALEREQGPGHTTGTTGTAITSETTPMEILSRTRMRVQAIQTAGKTIVRT
jgi:hypothetical protein